MSFHFRKKDYGTIYRRLLIVAGVLVNIILAYLINGYLGLPLYVDTIGTIFVAAIGGVFPGVLTAMLTNICLTMITPNALYYAIISVLIAIITDWYVRYRKFTKVRDVISYLFIISIISGVLATSIQFLILGHPQHERVSSVAAAIANTDKGCIYYFTVLIINIIINEVDKSITSGIAFGILYLIPASFKSLIRDSLWKQKPLTEENIQNAKNLKFRNSLLKKVTILLTIGAFSLVITISWISVSLYFNDYIEEYSTKARNTAEMVAELLDGDKVDVYLANGEDDSTYRGINNLMNVILKNSDGIKYLYVVRVEDENFNYIFDADSSQDDLGFDSGTITPVDEVFMPLLNKFQAGEEIGVVTNREGSNWILTAFKSVKNSKGEVVCYAAADVYFNLIPNFAKEFIIKTLLIFSGFLILAIVWGTSVSRYSLVFPIGSITVSARSFAEFKDNQHVIDAHVKQTRSLGIHTNDEVEELYKAICKMETDFAENVRSLRSYAAATDNMQKALISIMANMVENRDQDSCNHVQKSSEYVKIIVKGLKEKGYYPEKLTKRFINDVENSAPLHDIGKIYISEAIINKPGPLTDEEYEEIKKHTLYGKEILDKAIANFDDDNYLKEATNMAAYHHERWDGTGYPKGLHGEEIPLSARIMAVADVFDTLTSPKIYKKASTFEEAFEILKNEAGKQFDPKCVEVFLDSASSIKRVFDEYYEN